MLNKNIQKFGLWTSINFCFYFIVLAQILYNLNINFEIGEPIILSIASSIF